MEYMENVQQAIEQMEQADPASPDEDIMTALSENILENEEAAPNETEGKKKKSTRRRKTEASESEEPEDDEALDEIPEQLPMENSGAELQFGEDEGFGEEDPFPQAPEPGKLTDSEEENGPVFRDRRRGTRRPVVLDSSGNIIHEQSMGGLHDLSILTAARNGRKILTTTVDGIETDGDALPRVFFYVGTVKVMIPFHQIGFDLDPEMISQREARLIIDSMLGAKIDYMVRGVDAEARIAAASRRDAMLMRQRTILNARGINQPYRINEGMRVMARVVHVSAYAVRVEIYGFETYIRIDNISNLWVRDVREVIYVGDERPVEIIELVRGDDGRVTSIQASMKMAEEIPQLELREGSTYTGHIHGFSETAYFIRVAGIPTDIRCPVKSNHTMELLTVGDYVKFYVRGVYDGIPTGAILKVLKKHTAPGY